jgi:hypothetical protein
MALTCRRYWRVEARAWIFMLYTPVRQSSEP